MAHAGTPPEMLEESLMQEKYTYGLWGAAIGALAMTLVLPFGFGWMTAGGSAREANTAVSGVLLPICARLHSGKSGRSCGAEDEKTRRLR